MAQLKEIERRLSELELKFNIFADLNKLEEILKFGKKFAKKKKITQKMILKND
jgi:flagellar biosynthesis/type III secretory pathway chaperone